MYLSESLRNYDFFDSESFANSLEEMQEGDSQEYRYILYIRN